MDLMEGGRLTLLRTEDEERAAKADFAEASVAGLNLSAVRWITNQKLREVCLFQATLFIDNLFILRNMD